MRPNSHIPQLTTDELLVRDDLEAVNRRLRDSGMREIDRSDPTMRERYGL